MFLDLKMLKPKTSYVESIRSRFFIILTLMTQHAET